MDMNPNTTLPPGFRFHPTDEELIVYYLKNQTMSRPCPVSIIPEVDIYKFDPWQLPGSTWLFIYQLHMLMFLSFCRWCQLPYLFFGCKQRKQSLEKMNGISSAQETESIQTESVLTGQLFPVIGKRPAQTKPFTAVQVT